MFDICYINRPKLVEIARLCFQNDYYHAGIYVPNKKMVDNVVEDLMQITYLPNFRKLRKESNTNYQFLFGNGSSITVRVPSDTCRGHRMHSMVVDPDIDSKDVDDWLRFYEIEYEK